MSNPSYVALVTGGNRGIGLEVCRQLAARGLRTALAARTLARADQATRWLGDAGVRDLLAVELDVTRPETIAAAHAHITGRMGPVDVLVNNAAILLSEERGFLETPLEDFRATFETNVLGIAAVAQAFVPDMVRRRYGRVVNVSSRAGQLATMGAYAPAYSLSKTAVNAVTRLLAAETRGSGVLVNSADPGWVRTAMGGPHAPHTVEEGADTIVWLATLPASGPTGGFYSDRGSIAW